jgi:uncharacterized membrane protein HdeD (DUF308 family)
MAADVRDPASPSARRAKRRDLDMVDLAKLWWLVALIGVVSIVAGVILIAKPSNSLNVLAVVLGIFVLLDGIVELFSAFDQAATNRALSVIVGVLGIIIGIWLMRHPSGGVTAIGLVFGIWLVAAGMIRLVRAVVIPVNRGVHLLIALIEIVAGVVIVAEPHIGYATLAVIAGIALILNGLAALVAGITIHRTSSAGQTT